MPRASRLARTRRLLVLDLDHTLIHAIDVARQHDFDSRRGGGGGGDGGGRKARSFLLRGSGEDLPMRVYERCHLRRFLSAVRAMIHDDVSVAVWTAAQREYAVRVLDHIWPTWPADVLFVRTASHCTQLPSGDVIKDLRVLPHGYDVLLVDDNPVTCDFNRRHRFAVWHITPFWRSTVDSELLRVLDYVQFATRHDVPFVARAERRSSMPVCRRPPSDSSPRARRRPSLLPALLQSPQSPQSPHSPQSPQSPQRSRVASRRA